jgi:hypothetical protein
MPKKKTEELEQLELFPTEETTEVVEEEDELLETAESEEDEGVEGSLGENYGEVEKEIIYVDPATGETVDPNNLDPWGKIKFIATQLGQTIDEPNKKCKHCYGRGYTSIDATTKLPTPCSCVYTTYRKNNPHAETIRPKMNRASGRKYRKAISKYYRAVSEQMVTEQMKIEKSKVNLGKNTPGFIPLSERVVEAPKVEEVEAEVEPAVIETAEGTLNG